ncbi:MAG: hypothetical protein PWP05_438 [Thermovirga sp.]|nr:hypothetical protein [Thermovirga sp.]
MEMLKFWKVECPICGSVTRYSDTKGLDRGCEHFDRFVKSENLVLFIDGLGEEIPVALEDIADSCYEFECPLCHELVEGCFSSRKGHYSVETKCKHFLSMYKDPSDKVIVEFQDDMGEIHPMDVSAI